MESDGLLWMQCWWTRRESNHSMKAFHINTITIGDRTCPNTCAHVFRPPNTKRENMNRKKTFAASLILALALSFPVPCAVGDASKDPYVRFRLFSDCSPMWLVIENLSSDAKKIGLTEEALQAAVESRLRTARLYTSDTLKPYLYVQVSVVREAFSARLEYKKKSMTPFPTTSFMRLRGR